MPSFTRRASQTKSVLILYNCLWSQFRDAWQLSELAKHRFIDPIPSPARHFYKIQLLVRLVLKAVLAYPSEEQIS